MAALADILAKMRKVAGSHASISHSVLRIYADRIEEEVKRELAKVEAEALSAGGLVEAMRRETRGNAAAMREALITLRQRFNNNVMAYQDRYLKFSGWHWHKKAAEAARWRDVFFELREVCDAALAKPPRNCDVGTEQEQEVRFEAFCHAHKSRERCCEDCPIVADRASCEFTWAQMPYEIEEAR